MKKLAFLLMVASLLLLPLVAFADEIPTRLTAGGGNPASAMDVGSVDVWDDSGKVYVKYMLTNPVDPAAPQVGQWCLTQTHLDAQLDWELIPQTKKHSPIPGHFAYGDEVLECVGDVTYEIPNTWADGDVLYIAAHAVVQQVVGSAADLLGFEAALPDQVTMQVTYPSAGGRSYFPATTISGGTSLDGVYEGWCVDTDHTINQNTNYAADVYSSYETLPPDLVEYPENFDLVNWIINQGFVGQPSPGCSGAYTYGDVQRAIWALIENAQSTAGLGSWSPCRVDEILAAAQASGEDFTPDCGDVVAVVLAPVNAAQVIIAQVTTIEVGVPCTVEFESETAWGGPYPDHRFNNKDWSIYFDYTVQTESAPAATIRGSTTAWTPKNGLDFGSGE